MDLEWKFEYDTGITIIDEQHRKLVTTINKLFHSINELKVDTELKSILKELDDYADIHFETEETYFRKFHYKDTKNHIAAHQKFRDHLAELNRNYSGDKMKFSFMLADYLEDWLLNHLLTYDRQYIECFKEHGLN